MPWEKKKTEECLVLPSLVWVNRLGIDLKTRRREDGGVSSQVDNFILLLTCCLEVSSSPSSSSCFVWGFFKLTRGSPFLPPIPSHPIPSSKLFLVVVVVVFLSCKSAHNFVSFNIPPPFFKVFDIELRMRVNTSSFGLTLRRKVQAPPLHVRRLCGSHHSSVTTTGHQQQQQMKKGKRFECVSAFECNVSSSKMHSHTRRTCTQWERDSSQQLSESISMKARLECQNAHPLAHSPAFHLTI